MGHPMRPKVRARQKAEQALLADGFRMVSSEILWILSGPSFLNVSSTHCTSNKLGLFGQDFSKCRTQDVLL